MILTVVNEGTDRSHTHTLSLALNTSSQPAMSMDKWNCLRAASIAAQFPLAPHGPDR